MLSIHEALERILSKVSILSEESVDILEARDRVLREEVLATRDFPAFDNSAMDGYALRAEDTRHATREHPVSLQITQEIPASFWPTQSVEPGTAARIFTGAPIPKGADAVEIQENVKREGNTLSLTQPVATGKSIRVQGSHLQQGRVVLPKFSWLRSGEIGVLASLGRSWIRVSRRPRVAILSCGDELVDIDRTPSAGQIVESNRFHLATQVWEAGGIPTLLPLVPDQPEALTAAIQEGLKADILVSSGGASVGDYDLIRPTLQSLGIALDFWKVAIKPGKPLMFGTREHQLIFGLPGNPVSSWVTFELFVRPALCKMQGHPQPFRPRLQATLTAPIAPSPDRMHLVRGQLSWQHQGQAGIFFTPHPHQTSDNFLSMTNTQALAMIPPQPMPSLPGVSLEIVLLSPPMQPTWPAPKV